MASVQRYITVATITEFLFLTAVVASPFTVVAITEIDIVDTTTISSELTNLNEYCWTDTESCNIIGNFTRTTINLSFPVNIECPLVASNTTNGIIENVPNHRRSTDQHLFQRFRGIEVISLNGCGISVSHENSLLGLQFIPDPPSVRHLTLEMFKVIGALDAVTFNPFKQLRTLLLLNNHIERIEQMSFTGLIALNELILLENSIESIDVAAFQGLAKTLMSLTMHESALSLDGFLPLPSLLKIDISVKRLRWVALHAVPEVASLTVTNVERIEFNASVDEKQSFLNLTKLNVNFCHLTEMPIDFYPQLMHANLSHNQLKNISVHAMQMTQLQVLDISYNAFRVIDSWLLKHLRYLEHLNASNNRIAAINPKAFQRNVYLKTVDIRNNQLKSLNVDMAIMKVATELIFRIDDNPWNCAWINKFYGDDPHIFSMKFVYAKRVERKNMRGLECIMYTDDSHLFHSHLHDEDDQYHLTGERRRPQPIAPVEIMRRNPKHTAMLTICILIIGVSSLLISLYFYIKYRPLTSTLQPFYHTLPESPQQQKECLERRADIIRGRILPPTDYESPLSNRLAHFEIDGIALGLKDILRPMQNVDDEHFDDIEFTDLYEEIPDKINGSNEHIPDKVNDSDTQIN